MKCPKCGYEAPIEAPIALYQYTGSYQYTGYLREHLPTILKLLRMGHSPHEVAETLRSLHGPIISQWGSPPSSMINYIRRRYGLDKALPTTTNRRQERNEKIASEYETGGVTYAELGRKYNLSRERIHGIVAKAERIANRNAVAEAHLRAAERIEDIPLEAIDVSVRISNCLHNHGCKTVGDAMKLTDRELIRMPNFGMRSLREWREVVTKLREQLANR